jgi:DNA-directed RNA polymerase I, II, and III subunit RPABC2
MSYFDENYPNNGGDASDDEKNSSSGSDSETETETNIDENEVEVEIDDDDDVAEGKDTDNESDEGDKDVEGVEGTKTNYKEQYGVDFGSDDDEDVVDYAKRRKLEIDAKENGSDSDNGSDGEPEQTVSKKKTKKIPASKQKVQAIVYDEEDDEDPTGEVYLQKFDKEINDNYLVNFHPESAVHNYDEILAMTNVTRDKNGIIIDELHKTIPFLTKYEKARVLGQRAKQINSGATVFVKVPEKVIDGYLIAELELIEKRIPFIIRRPLPSGGSEYWSIKDLENISF